MHVHDDAATVGHVAEEQQFGERLLDRLLDQAGHRPRAKRAVEALLGQPGARGGRQVDR